MRSKPTNTARGTPWDWRTCGALAKREKRRRAYPSKRREARRRALRLDAVRCRGPWVRSDPWRPARPRCFFRRPRQEADDGEPRADQTNRGGGALATALVIPGRERSERTRNPGRHGRADNRRPGFRAPAGVYHRAGLRPDPLGRPRNDAEINQRRAHRERATSRNAAGGLRSARPTLPVRASPKDHAPPATASAMAASNAFESTFR